MSVSIKNIFFKEYGIFMLLILFVFEKLMLFFVKLLFELFRVYVGKFIVNL